jgi:glycosyltransferase involved in cell wall biosynthesis
MVVDTGGLRPLRVVHVLGEVRASGAETMLESAGARWRDHDVRCEVVAIGPREGAFASRLRGAGYVVHHLPASRRPGFFWRFARLVRQLRVDVVHIHVERASTYLEFMARLAGAAVVRTVHNAFPFEGGLARRRRAHRRIARWIGVRSVAVSRTVEMNEQRRFADAPSVIENWIALDRFRPPSAVTRAGARSQHGVTDGSFAVVTVGNCRPAKNHRALLEALSGIEDLEWVWLHVGSEDLDASERRRASALGVEARCRFLGSVDPQPALHAADLFVMPSWYEGVGLATVEALATGLPVVLTDVPGNQDLAGLSPLMWWSSPDPDELRAAIRKAYAEIPDDAEAAKVLQRERVSTRFDPGVGVASYVAAYRAAMTR